VLPRQHDVTTTGGSDVTDRDVSGVAAGDWLQQLVMLSRFITLEYFSDGAALTKALSTWW